MAENSGIPFGTPEVLGTVVGGALAYLLTTNAPYGGSAVMCAVVLVLLAAASRRSLHPALWWGGIGAVAGSIIGTGITLDVLLKTQAPERRAVTRHVTMITLGAAGFLSGILAGRNSEHPDVPKPAEFLKRASAATLVLYAVVVTASFPTEGLDTVRTLSSRLSSLTTILVTTLALPGWIGLWIRARWETWRQASREARGDFGVRAAK